MITSGNIMVLLAGGVCFVGRESGLSRRLIAWVNYSEKLTPFVLSILSGFVPILLDVIVQMGCGNSIQSQGELWWLRHRAGGSQALLCRSLAPLPRVQVFALLAGTAQLPTG